MNQSTSEILQTAIRSNAPIHSLRKAGIKVRIFHSRITNTGSTKLAGPKEIKLELLPVRDIKDRGLSMHTKGGKTEVSITTPDGKDYQATAECSMEDSFCYKLGNRICLGRILKQLNSTKFRHSNITGSD